MKYEIGVVTRHQRTRLPHWDAEHAIYFVTWRLDDALPAPVVVRLKQIRDHELARIKRERGTVTRSEQFLIERAYGQACPNFLDEHHGDCLLRRAECARIVSDALEHFDAVRYLLYAWVVMPNHVHIVLTCIAPHRLSEILHSLKSYTSKQVNTILGRSGSIWQTESFDRCIRDAKQLQATVQYVINNPVKAGLTDYPFVRSYPDRLASLT